MAALATVAAIAAGVLCGAVVAAAFPGLVLVALLAAVAWPVMGWVGRRRAHARRLAVRSEAAPAVLEAAERWGAPPAEALAARAEALRGRARLNAEAEAGRAAVRLAFPLVLCFLPAFVLLTVVPTIAGALQALTP
jgi:tight adherence protein B